MRTNIEFLTTLDFISNTLTLFFIAELHYAVSYSRTVRPYRMALQNNVNLPGHAMLVYSLKLRNIAKSFAFLNRISVSAEQFAAGFL
jgi:hypothetical protein